MHWMRCGLMMAALAIILGAFGAHALKDTLALTNHTEHWKTAVQYQFMAVPGLLLIAFVCAPWWVGWALVLGAVLFSGSLYVLALEGPAWMGPVTPLGGLFLILGYVGLALRARPLKT